MIELSELEILTVSGALLPGNGAYVTVATMQVTGVAAGTVQNSTDSVEPGWPK